MDPCEIDWEVPELSFRNATRGFLYQAEASNLPIPLELPLQVLAAFAGLNMHLVVLAEELAVACPTAHSLERFDFICQQVRGSIRDLVTKFPLRLPRAEGLLQEAVENCMNIGLEILHHLLGGLCMQLPSPNQCRESLWCYKLYQRLTKATAEVAVSSHLVQDQLEASVLWQFDAPKAPATLHHHSPPLPQFPSNAEGEVRTQDDLRIKTLSALLRAMGPQDLHMVEVGTHLGHVADGLLSRFPRLHYVGIDPYPGEYDGRPILLGSGDLGDSANFNRTRTRLSRFGSRAQLCRCTSGTVASSLEPSALTELDLVFIDGAHDFESVDMDLKKWIPQVKPGAVVAGHDYRLGEAEHVVKAVHKRLSQQLSRIACSCSLTHLPKDRALQLAPDGVWWWLA
ncbi:Uncharacterized protein SCF082_LOCUS17660 [Durusdinium trenchii]|uniref:Class I SAM-dependent methyltransferase n=1 Tax=Durusdinium trenchii TaxID=1381693 RepID=A0ABP0KKI5_9DINO